MGWGESLANLADRPWFTKLKPVLTINNLLADLLIRQTSLCQMFETSQFAKLSHCQTSLYRVWPLFQILIILMQSYLVNSHMLSHNNTCTSTYVHILYIHTYVCMHVRLIINTLYNSRTSLKLCSKWSSQHINQLIKDNFYGLYRPWQYNLTTERGLPLYNNKIDQISWSQSVHCLEV